MRIPMWVLAPVLVAIGLGFCMVVFGPGLVAPRSEAHGSRAKIRRGPTLPATCKGSELFIHETPGPVIMVADPASCSGVAVWEETQIDEVVTEWPSFVSSYFDERVKLTITGGATNTLVIEEALAGNGELELNLLGKRMRVTSPSSIDLSTIEASGNTVDDALPFSYVVWFEETGGPGACAEGSLNCAVLAGTRDTPTAVEYTANALIAIPVVQTPATVSTDGPLLVDPLFHALPLSAKSVQDTASTGDGLSAATIIALGGDGTTFLTVNEIAWVTVHGFQVVSAFDMATEPAFILDSVADASGQEPFDEVNSMADVSELSDGTTIGTTNFFHLTVFQGVYEIAGISYSRVFLNPPTCSYTANNLADALIDLNSCTNFTRPTGFKSLAQIGRVLVKNDTNLINSIDTPAVAAANTEGGFEGVGNIVGPDGAGDGNVAVFDGVAGHRVRDSGTPYPPLMMEIERSVDQLLSSGVDEFIAFDLETDDDDDWFDAGVDDTKVEVGFTGRLEVMLTLRADVDPAGAPKELCVRIYVDGVLPAGVEYGCFLTSDTNDTSAPFFDVFDVVPGTDLTFEVLGTADLAMRATLNCERKL